MVYYCFTNIVSYHPISTTSAASPFYLADYAPHIPMNPNTCWECKANPQNHTPVRLSEKVRLDPKGMIV